MTEKLKYGNPVSPGSLCKAQLSPAPIGRVCPPWSQVGSQPSNSRPLQSTIAHRGKNCPNHGQDVAWQEVGGELDHVGATFDVGQSWPCRCQPQSIRRIFASEQVISELFNDGLWPFLYFSVLFQAFYCGKS